MAEGGWNDTPDIGNDSSFNGGGFSEANISQHDTFAAGDDAPHDGGCRFCHQDGHFARDCPDKPAGGSGCFNCGEEGHNKADCPNPAVEREFTGACRICSMNGHRAADCPEKPPMLCNVCKAEGHTAAECQANRVHAQLGALGLAELTPEEAWVVLEKADQEKDVDDIKLAVYTYAKAFPSVTFEELEQVFRDAHMNTYLIAKQQEISGTHTIVNLQGKSDQKFVVSFQFSPQPRRAKFAEGWPSSAEENLTRLTDAGFVMDSFVPKCINCGEIGHKSKQCEQEKRELVSTAITCANCSMEGHRARDCTEARKSSKKGCRNCGGDHMAKDCDQPRNMDTVECKNCNNMGHFSRDCPDREPELCRNCGQEGHRKNDCTNERVMQCRNCDQWGHMSRECPKPFDPAKLKCSNCGAMGHSYKRCTEPPKQEDDGDNVGDSAAGGGEGGWGNGESSAAPADGGW